MQLGARVGRLADLPPTHLATAVARVLPQFTETTLFALGGELLEVSRVQYDVLALSANVALVLFAFASVCPAIQVRRRAKQAAKVADSTEAALNVKLDLINLESQAETSWRNRLLDILEEGLFVLS